MAPKKKRRWLVYLVRCLDNTLYCGVTTDIENRVQAHNQGNGAKYTRSRRPVILVAQSGLMTRGDALRLERQIKKLRAPLKIDALHRFLHSQLPR